MTKQEDYGKIEELYKQGYCIREIAEKLDIPELAVTTFLWSELVNKLPNSTTVVKRDRNTGKITITRYDNANEEEEYQDPLRTKFSTYTNYVRIFRKEIP